MEMWDVKRKKKEKESCKSILFARFDAWCLHHDLSIVYQAQASLSGFLETDQPKTLFLSMYVR